ncbi:MAG: hypothetical protein HRF49_01425 [bacterium]|jgi:hypothetical protein
MTNNVSALTVGSAEIYINGEKCGWATDVEIEKRVEVLRHESNVGLEFATDHVVPLRRSFIVRGRFGEVDPPTINNALGLSGLSAQETASAQGMTEYARLYPGRWYTLRFPSTGTSIVLKTADGQTTFVKNTDYEVSAALDAIKLKDNSAIAPGELLLLSYSYQRPPYSEVALSAPGFARPVHLVLVHRYPDGASFFELTLPRVLLEADVSLAFDEKDWIGIEFSGECLPDESDAAAPFGRQKFFGPIFENMGLAAGDVESNPYVPEIGPTY